MSSVIIKHDTLTKHFMPGEVLKETTNTPQQVQDNNENTTVKKKKKKNKHKNKELTMDSETSTQSHSPKTVPPIVDTASNGLDGSVWASSPSNGSKKDGVGSKLFEEAGDWDSPLQPGEQEIVLPNKKYKVGYS